MMDFGAHITTRRGSRDGNIVPMINVVFLLLVFFLMTAQINPSEPIDVRAPSSLADPSETLPEGVLFIAADGSLAFETTRGEAVFSHLPTDAPLAIRADREVDAQALAALLPRLAALGVSDVTLLTEAP